MNETVQLYRLPPHIRKAILAFLVLLTAGVLFGLALLFENTGMSSAGTAERYSGPTASVDDLEIPDHYALPRAELYLTTHNHLIGFAFIFAMLAALLTMSSLVRGWVRSVLMVEPFVSVLITFLSIWGIRFLNPAFVMVTMIAGILTYLSYFAIVGIIAFELLFKAGRSSS